MHIVIAVLNQFNFASNSAIYVYALYIFWPLCCLFFFHLRILIAPLVSPNFKCVSMDNWF
jgi:hypothetical protein